MKKLVIISVALILLAAPLMSQDVWLRDSSLEELFSIFEIQVEVWVNEDYTAIKFEDVVSHNFGEMLFQLSYIMVALDFAFDDANIDFEDIGFKYFTYSLFLPNGSSSVKREDRYDEHQYHRYDLFLQDDWLEEYFDSSRRERDAMLLQEFKKQRDTWKIPISSKH